MRIIIKDGKVIGTHGDFENRQELLDNYGAGTAVYWIPAGTLLLPSPGGGIADPRENMAESAVRSCRRQDIDDRTDELLAAGFTYDNKQFKMDLEHQNSYMFDYLLNQEYPHTVKGVGDAYLTFADRDAHTLFIGTGFGTGKVIIEGGWALKDALDAMDKAALLAWTDPR